MWKEYLSQNIEDLRGKLKKHATKEFQKEERASPRFITMHHSGTSAGDAASFASYHVNHHGWPGIGYHFVIKNDGGIQWCHDLTVRSYHTGGRNTQNTGICLVGANSFGDRQIEASKQLVYALCRHFRLTEASILGHREHPGQRTACPAFNMNQFRQSIQSRLARSNIQAEGRELLRTGSRGDDVKLLQRRLLEEGFSLPKFGVDGIFGPETERAVIAFQRENGLVQDGIAGPITWGALLNS